MSSDEEGIIEIGEVFDAIDEENALVMGGIDSRQICSFTKGYMKRQAVYTCNTCLDISKVKAGFCYPCSLNCHAGHDLVELYTKRNFRCDCGNSKFEMSFKCQLWEEKDDINSENSYDETFSNKYCTCQRPYPDESYEGDEDMIQCGICEDWFHPEHLNMQNEAVPDEYEELTCFKCMRKFSFLVVYAMETLGQPNVCELLSSILEPSSKRPKLSPNKDCRLVTLVSELGLNDFDVRRFTSSNAINADNVSSVFWRTPWRDSLCKCTLCLDMYKELHVRFLLDSQDTMTYYLNVGKQRVVELDNEASEAMNKVMAEMPHNVAVDVASAIGEVKKAIEDFFSQEREEGHDDEIKILRGLESSWWSEYDTPDGVQRLRYIPNVITAEEVKSFFAKLRQTRYPM